MKLCVLVADESLTVRMDLCEALARENFLAVPCANPLQLREQAALCRVDALLIDSQFGVDARTGRVDSPADIVQEIRAHVGPGLAVAVLSGTGYALEAPANRLELHLPKPYNAEHVAAELRRLVRARRGPTRGPRPIVIVDDSPTFRNALAAELTANGYQVVTAASGEEGLRVIADVQPLAAIIDGILPGIDGATLIRRIRLDAALRGVPCLLMTASSDIDDELRGLESGADAFVRKDDEMPVLLARVAALLRAASESKLVQPSLSALATRTILAVDDSITYREELSRSLHLEGYEVLQAPSGEAALELLATHSVDCILLDLVMEGIGGHETCRRIKTSPVTRDIPVMVLTSVEDRTAMLEGLAVGADDFIQKSPDFSVLKARVRAQLRRRQFEDETRRVRERLLRSEIEAADARAAREVAEARTVMVAELEHKNQELHALAEEFRRANEALGDAYSDLQRTQAQLVQSAKMASLGELVAGIAHEINNPLAFVLSHLGTVREGLARVEREGNLTFDGNLGVVWTRTRDRLGAMDAGLQRIRELVIKLRTFSRIDEGELNRVSVRDCVESVLMILEHRLKDRITVNLSLATPDHLECFPALLNQALMNLVANAIDAIEGPGAISIQSQWRDDKLELAITDTGKGIPESVRERILEPFFTTKAIGEGTGLGLSITYSIVQKHGGQLVFGGAEGGGTRAVMLLPSRQMEENNHGNA
jgi:two-component system, NtrC family, sensor kinase